MIRAVAFDWGGVLIDNPTPGLVEYTARSLGVDGEELFTVFQEYLEHFQKGLVTEADLWRDICKKLGTARPSVPSLYREAVEHVFTPHRDVFALVYSLRDAGYKTGFLSNTEVPAMEYFLDRHYDCFDATVFSCAEQCVKPEERIYRILLERLHTPPEQTLFVDDREEYVAGARTCGMQAVRYECLDSLRAAFSRLDINIRER